MLNGAEVKEFSWHDEARCPGYGILKCQHLNESGMEMPSQVAYASIVSSLFSCVASILIVFSYARWRDIRTGSRSVITFLAIADFFTAFGYVMGSMNYLVAFKQHDCGSFDDLCTIQSFITSWSSISSFFWTVALAFYLYLTLVHTKIFLANRLIPFFHVFCWGFPILICFPLLVTWKLGYSPYAASTWCYIRPIKDKKTAFGIILVAGKLWEITSYFLVIGLYTAIKCHIRKQTRLGEESNYLSSSLIAAVRKADSKLVFIPVVFVLLRMWGTIEFFYTISLPTHDACIPTKFHSGLVFLGVMQALGDGGQGWGNFILYVLASSKIRNRLFGWLIDRLPCCSKSEMTEEITPKPGNGYARIPRPEILSQYSSINEGGERINYGTIGMEPTTLSNSDSDS